MFKLLAVAAVLIGVGTGSVAAESPPTDPPIDISTVPMDGSFGYGEADLTQYAYPICAPTTAANMVFEGGVLVTSECLPTSSPVPQEVRQIEGQPCLIEGDYEGQITDSAGTEMLLACMVPMIKAWIDVSITNNVHSVQPTAYVFVPTGTTGVGFGTITEDGEVQTGCPFDENVMQYCNLDGIVYIGQERAWWYYTKGDAALLEVLGHETGHRFQHIAEIPAAENDNAQVYRENQADCVAGVWMDYLSEHQSLYQDDVLDFATGIIAIGSSIEGEQRTHGTADQRMRAFYLGYNNPGPSQSALMSCNGYISNSPLLDQAAPTS